MQWYKKLFLLSKRRKTNNLYTIQHMKKLLSFILLIVYIFASSYLVHAQSMDFIIPHNTQSHHCHQEPVQSTSWSTECLEKCIGDYTILSTTTQKISTLHKSNFHVFVQTRTYTEKNYIRHRYVQIQNTDPPNTSTFSPYQDFVGITILTI